MNNRDLTIFRNTREVSWLVIFGVIALFTGTSLINLFVLARHKVFFNLHDITRGLIHPILLYCLISLVLLCFAIFGWGRLKPKEVGFLSRDLKPALFFLFGFWLVAQGCYALLSWVRAGSLEWNTAWDQGWPGIIGLFVAHVLGTAVYEELAFRGFMLPQLFLKLGGSPENQSQRHLVYAILSSQMLFALAHIPVLVLEDLSFGLIVARLGACLFLGLIFAILYVRTGNLLLAVGIHALIDSNTSMVNGIEDSVEHAVYAVFLIILLFIWPKFRAQNPSSAEDKTA